MPAGKPRHEAAGNPRHEAAGNPRHEAAGNPRHGGCNNHEAWSLPDVRELLRTSQPTTTKLQSIKFNDGEVYRYFGCKTCTFSIRKEHKDGKYYCKGACNNRQPRKSSVGVVTERKICVIIHNVTLSDDQDELIESVVIFNSICVRLLKKSGNGFVTDNEAVTAWKELIANNCFDITLQRNDKKKGSVYPPPIKVQFVDNVIGIPSTTRTDMYDSTLDSVIGIQSTTPNTRASIEPTPDFPEYDMKLKHSSEPYENFVTKYRIASRPPGLVLLINNFDFPHHIGNPQRKGSEVDIKTLQKGFGVMGFEIFRNECQMNIRTREEFRKLIRDFKNELLRRDFDSIFIVISSHGQNNQVALTTEGQSICVVRDIMIPFSNTEFPKYQGKPKVFMPITCQDLGDSASGNSIDFLDNQLFDMLVCCPSLPGYPQNRNTIHGSYFVHCLMYNCMQYATSWHLTDILNKVQRDFRDMIRKKGLWTYTVPHYIGSTFGYFVLVPTAGMNDDAMEIDDDY